MSRPVQDLNGLGRHDAVLPMPLRISEARFLRHLMAAVDAINGRYGRGGSPLERDRADRTAADLGDEAGEKDTTVHDAAAGCAGGQGLNVRALATVRPSCRPV